MPFNRRTKPIHAHRAAFCYIPSRNIFQRLQRVLIANAPYAPRALLDLLTVAAAVLFVILATIVLVG